MEGTLSNFGYSFQIKLISCLLTDQAFSAQVFDILKEEYFESDSIKWTIKKCLSYYNEFKLLPTLDVLKVYLDKVDDNLLKQEVINNLKDAIRYIESTDLEFIKKTVLDFCRRKEMVSAILQSVEFVKKGDMDSIYSVIQKAMNAGVALDLGLDYFGDIETRYTADARSTIATGWPVLDSLLKGGLSRGELGILIANSGVGKSWLLSCIGANALRLGKTVFHITLELDQSYSGLRYDAILSGVTLDKLQLHRDKLSETLSTIPGKLYIKWYPMKSISLMGIRAYVEKAKAMGITPDLIIIDYIDLVKYVGTSTKEDVVLKEIYEETKGLAGELAVPIWSVSQANREGLDEDILQANKISGAYAKMFPADFVASISRKIQDKISNTGRFHVIKNRFGPDGLTFPVMMDTNRGVIEIYDEISIEGRQTAAKMKSDQEFAKNNAKKRYNEMFKKDESKANW